VLRVLKSRFASLTYTEKKKEKNRKKKKKESRFGRQTSLFVKVSGSFF
jgi:hypothetical protein